MIIMLKCECSSRGYRSRFYDAHWCCLEYNLAGPPDPQASLMHNISWERVMRPLHTFTAMSWRLATQGVPNIAHIGCEFIAWIQDSHISWDRQTDIAHSNNPSWYLTVISQGKLYHVFPVGQGGNMDANQFITSVSIRHQKVGRKYMTIIDDNDMICIRSSINPGMFQTLL